ncbi:hypothetical protein PHYPO_G00106110 [Pangasianodon hypophthalmus]|uniref:Uncharacterized protein n=1 Tax=Pangasianodon hypophthalmus TaxID=310915 RepID=A0A5N5PYW7_PANHP|nr:hypothetical protein PHYPO_G00106110 [Pangasianodon hypophthalmus]
MCARRSSRHVRSLTTFYTRALVSFGTRKPADFILSHGSEIFNNNNKNGDISRCVARCELAASLKDIPVNTSEKQERKPDRLGDIRSFWQPLTPSRDSKNPDELIDLFTRRDLRGGRGASGRSFAERQGEWTSRRRRAAEGGAYRIIASWT